MRDIVGIIGITAYWFLLALILTNVSNDPTLNELNAAYTGNYTTSIVNVTGLDLTNQTETGTSYAGMFGRMLTFRIPDNSAFPPVITSIIEITNFLLIGLFLLLLYRQIRSGSG